MTKGDTAILTNFQVGFLVKANNKRIKNDANEMMDKSKKKTQFSLESWSNIIS